MSSSGYFALNSAKISLFKSAKGFCADGAPGDISAFTFTFRLPSSREIDVGACPREKFATCSKGT